MTLRNKLIDYFDRAGEAHFDDFESTNGADADWPIWYARHLQAILSKELAHNFTVSELVYCLMQVEFERQARGMDIDWRPYYADHFLERFAAPKSLAGDKLELYQTAMCPFCVYVRSAITRLGVKVELRDIRSSQALFEELHAARGRGTVPVLKITSPDGSVRWMPESQDIVNYLETHYG